MDRRTFIGTLAGGLLAAPRAVEGQEPKAAKIGFLLGGTLSSPGIHLEPFKQTLRERGWIEGKNLTLVDRYGEGQHERLPALARELLDLGVDVIVAEGTPPTRAAKQVTTTVPIVMVATGDPQKRGRALRFVAQADLKILDPVWTTAYITRNHGYLVYDTLFGTDEQQQIKAQMVDQFTVSTDGMKYTFTLRNGLKWHDGQTVRSEDCVESLKRWGKKDRFGQLLMAHTGKIV